MLRGSPLFFPNADLSKTPNIAAYMKRCAERPAFAKAFGQQHQGLVLSKCSAWLESGGAAGSPADMLKGLFM